MTTVIQWIMKRKNYVNGFLSNNFMSKNIITSIDIGSFTTNIVVLQKNDHRLKIAARASVPTKGVEHGYIMNIPEARESIARAMVMAEHKLGDKIQEVIVSASGTGLESRSESVSTIVTLGSGEVADLDIEKSIQKASAKARMANRKIIESLATTYVLDGKPVVGSPLGMKGKKLETTVFFIDFPTTTIEAIEDICEQLDVDLLDIIPSPLACSCVSLSDIERKVGSILVDIGSDSTSLLVYEHDTPLLMKTVEFGSKDITNAIALALKVTVEEAEQIKLGAHPEHAHTIPKVEKTIEKKLNELFKVVNEELAVISKKQLLPAGIILSGGGALTPGIEEAAKEKLCIPARKGSPKSVKADGGDYDIPWSVAYGLAVLGLERKHAGMYGSFGNITESAKQFMKKFFI